MSGQPADHAGPDDLMKAIQADDVEGVRAFLDRNAELKARLNDPIGPFDSPALTSAGVAR